MWPTCAKFQVHQMILAHWFVSLKFNCFRLYCFVISLSTCMSFIQVRTIYLYRHVWVSSRWEHLHISWHGFFVLLNVIKCINIGWSSNPRGHKFRVIFRDFSTYSLFFMLFNCRVFQSSDPMMKNPKMRIHQCNWSSFPSRLC